MGGGVATTYYIETSSGAGYQAILEATEALAGAVALVPVDVGAGKAFIDAA